MSIEAVFWKEDFFNRFPPWPCANCGMGRLELVPESLQRRSSAEFRAMWHVGAADDDAESGVFVALLECTTCTDFVSVAGTYAAEIWREYRENQTNNYIYRPLYLKKAPAIFLIPDQVPDAVSSVLRESFELFWIDIEACANRIRTALERLLDLRKIRKTELREKKNKPNKQRVGLSLHRRIRLFAEQDSTLADQLMAIKWIGNAGSHASSRLQRADVLDGYEIIEHVLEKLFGEREKRVKAMTRQINRRGKPRSHSRKRASEERKDV